MASTTREDLTLLQTEGFVLESPEGDLGRVEEVWLGEGDEPHALVVRTEDGRHGLLRREEVLTVDRENHWVVVPSEPALLELDTPRVVATEGEANVAATWATTGNVLRAEPRRPPWWHLPFRLPGLRKRAREPLLWQAIAVLLGSIVLIVAAVIALASLLAELVAGAAY